MLPQLETTLPSRSDHFGHPVRRARGAVASVLVAFVACGVGGTALRAQTPGQAATPAAAAPDGSRTEAPAFGRSAASIATVVTRDASGNRLAKGIGVFIDIGRLVLPRALLLDRAHSAGVIVGGQEQRVTAIVADDVRAGLTVVAVNLPDGAPPPIKALWSRTALAAGTYHAVDADGRGRATPIAAEREVVGFGPVCAVAPAPSLPASGTPLVDDDGEMVGVLVQRTAGDQRLAVVVPASRVLELPAVGAVTLGEWAGRADSTRPVETESAFLRGVGASLEGRPDEAARSFREAAAANAGDADAHAALASSELAAGNRDGAFESYRAAIAADPDNPRWHHDLGVAFSDAGRWEDAAGEFAHVVRLRPRDAEARFNLGTAYGQLGRHQDEYGAYQAALQENSAHVKALRNMGIVCIAMKHYAEAVAVSARALRLLPSDAPLHAQLGVAYYDLGNYPSAIEELKKAAELEPGFAKAQYGLGVVYAASGQKEAALQVCERLQALDPARAAELRKFVTGRQE